MAIRLLAHRLGVNSIRSPRVVWCRAFSEGTGRILSEEERAAENIYIKKMEKEKMEKLARKGLKPEEHSEKGTASSDDSAPAMEPVANNTKNIAVLATVVAVVAAGWWFFRSSSKPKEEDKD